MKKKLISILLSTVLTAGMLTGCGSKSSSENETTATDTASTTEVTENASGAGGEYDLTLYSINTTDPDFDAWLTNVEEATGLKINAIAAPTDSDTRQQKITTMLSTQDKSVDIMEVNDEMATAFKNSGWLEPLNDTVMTEDIVNHFATGYVSDMITAEDGSIIGVPGYAGYLALWVNQEIMDEVGMDSIDNLDDFKQYIQSATKDGRYGYGGSWEKTYVFNEIAEFVNLFGGDYYDWSNEGNREALQFMYDMVNTWKVTPIDQIADKYEQMNQKFIDGKYGCVFYWGTGSEYAAADMLGTDKIHQIAIPTFQKSSIFTDSWSYVMNSASEHKDAAVKFLQYMASEGGMQASWDNFDRYPARSDVAEKIVPDDSAVKEMYTTYATKSEVRGRPMLPQTMEFISDMGTIFQDYMQDKITLDQFCEKAQAYVEECQ
ncbi:MAG: extracellular solute-binding protein [Lachnospiraceae bacterium]|nr:extracellular solute-binding protein [Lachnospiraceae bacterium]